MYPLDPRAEALIGRSHGIAARLLGSVNGSDFVLPLQLEADSASIDVDGSSPMRRKLSATVIARYGDAVLDPIAAELRAEYAIIDPTSGHAYWIPVGTFVVTDAEEVDDNRMQITGEDRWLRVSEARFERPITTSGDIVETITQLLLDADSRITVDSSAAPSGFTHRSTLHERDRDKAVLQLASSIGCLVYFDPLGVARIEPVRDLGVDAVWQITPGVGGTKIRSVRGVSRSRTYNAVAVTGDSDGTTPPVYAVARDDEPSSPTRWGGRFGKRTRFYSSSYVTTTAQAQAVADAQLARYRRVTRSLVVETMQHPGLDAGDVIRAHTAPGRYELMRVGAFTLTLGLATTAVTAESDADEDEGE